MILLENFNNIAIILKYFFFKILFMFVPLVLKCREDNYYMKNSARGLGWVWSGFGLTKPA